jgi:large subunit ribosomal protein L4
VGTSLKKYNLRGEEVGTVQVSDVLSEARAHSQLVKDYIVALRANARAWTACTKTRSEMSHSTKKPHPQKGGGRSRQGSLVAPQYRGGGRVFGPKPKPEFHVQVNQKERRSAIRALIADKIRNGSMIVVDSLSMDAPKSAAVRKFLNGRGCTRRVLMLGEGSYMELGGEGLKIQLSIGSDAHETVKKSVRNLHQVEFSLVRDVDGYAVALANNIVVSEAALSELEQWLAGEGAKEG